MFAEFVIWEELYFCAILFLGLLVVGGAICIYKAVRDMD